MANGPLDGWIVQQFAQRPTDAGFGRHAQLPDRDGIQTSNAGGAPEDGQAIVDALQHGFTLALLVQHPLQIHGAELPQGGGHGIEAPRQLRHLRDDRDFLDGDLIVAVGDAIDAVDHLFQRFAQAPRQAQRHPPADQQDDGD